MRGRSDDGTRVVEFVSELQRQLAVTQSAGVRQPHLDRGWVEGLSFDLSDESAEYSRQLNVLLKNAPGTRDLCDVP
jgi:hypothetical protein